MSTAITHETLAIARPKRWDHPLSRIEPRELAWLLSQSPFVQMDASRFPTTSSLRDILRNDTRISRFEPGDIILREGDYGSSAFLVLDGQVRVLLSKWMTSERHHETKSMSWWKALQDSLKHWPHREMRQVATSNPDSSSAMSVRNIDERPRVFLQDVQTVLKHSVSEPLGAGQIFGELAAMTRSPSNFTVAAETNCVLLEIRWQGLRLLRRDPQFRDYLDNRYRESSLQSHLRECWMLQYLPETQLQAVADATELVSFGDMEWFAEYAEARKLDVQQQIAREPVIAMEATPADFLFVVRAGFARLSHQQGGGHKTLSYLGKGQLFGLDELCHSFRVRDSQPPLPYQESLRAIGFVDLLRIPKKIVYEQILPFIRKSHLPPTLDHPRYDPSGNWVPENRTHSKHNAVDTSFLEFLVDQRLINGRQTMIIDTDRCTRCDDCVTACARTHQGNPRFVRQGPQFGKWMFAHACMHCNDPVCMIGCPTGAIARSASTGTVSINPQTCIGCKTCAESCPYENISMVQVCDMQGRKLVDQQSTLPILQATKCDLCHDQISGPACQNACPHDALVRMDMGDLPKLAHWLHRKSA